jgi:transposase
MLVLFPVAEGIGMARGKRSTTGGREQFWREQLRQQQVSGQGVRAYCEGAGLSVPSFYWWRREVRVRDARRGGSRRPQFVPVQITPKPPMGTAVGVEVVLAGGRSIRVGPGFDADHLRAVVAALEAVPC